MLRKKKKKRRDKQILSEQTPRLEILECVVMLGVFRSENTHQWKETWNKETRSTQFFFKGTRNTET